jgi:hypothetical protein
MQSIHQGYSSSGGLKMAKPNQADLYGAYPHKPMAPDFNYSEVKCFECDSGCSCHPALFLVFFDDNHLRWVCFDCLDKRLQQQIADEMTLLGV